MMHKTYLIVSFAKKAALLLGLVLAYFVCFGATSYAATLSLSPNTGVYPVNSTFSVSVSVAPDGKSINAADGTLSFNPRELSVVSVNRSNSIFNLWVTEPAFSNSAGTVSFSGGSPAGYSGRSGTIMTVTFKALTAGSPRVSFKNGSVLANDGKGTNILTAMNGGSYTIQAAVSTPVPEVIEYVAPANTPAAPKVTSDTHPDSAAWYTSTKAELVWLLPEGVTAVRTLLDTNSSSIPTKVYEDAISSITLDDLDEGVQYFHVQFKNSEGWGKVAHYRLAVDTVKPVSIDVALSAGADLANPVQTLMVKAIDETSLIEKFKVKLDANEPFEVTDITASGTVTLPALEPGYHTAIVEAFDQAGNSIVGTFAFTILAFDRPVFTEYPSEVSEQVIPVIKGQTRPNATVDVSVTKLGSEAVVYQVTANETGEFIFIPEGKFASGVYELTARATDTFGAQSELSDPVRIAVQQPGFIRIGSLLVSALSVLVPLVVLIAVLLFGIWYLFIYARRFRKAVRVESIEALQILRREFAELQTTLMQQSRVMAESRRTKKLTIAEESMIELFAGALRNSQQKVEREIVDIADLTNKSDKK